MTAEEVAADLLDQPLDAQVVVRMPNGSTLPVVAVIVLASGETALALGQP